MFKHNSVGRLGFFLGISVLTSACAVGEIGDFAGEPRLDVGFNDAALTCPGVSADVSASDGWESKQASQPAPDSLYFEVMVRPTEANLDALVAVGAQNIDEFSDAAISVRFAASGLIDVRDGSAYASDATFAYEAGVWYQISIAADIAARTYDVAVGRCGASTQPLITGAAFQSEASASNQLTNWALWSSQSAMIELSTPTWIASGSCAPATCESLGAECGQLSDGCGGTLNCGGCGAGQMCSSRLCIDNPDSPPTAPPDQGLFWFSKEQTEGEPWGYSQVQCEHPIDNTVNCSDANGANLTRVPNPLPGGGYALRHYAEVNGSDEGARSQVGIFRGWDNEWNDAVTSGTQVYIAEDLYFPEEIVGTGEFPWFAIFDMHAVNSQGDNRWYGNPGFTIKGWDATPPGNMWVEMDWANGPGGLFSVPLPVGEWFTFEFSYRWSKTANATSQVWINGQLVYTVNNIQTAASDHVYAELYSKAYGDDNGATGNWSPNPVIYYRRNMRASYSPLTH